MRHRYFGRNLSRTKNEKRMLLLGLARSMFHHGQITTTLAKAKAVQPNIEKIITLAKSGKRSHVNQLEKVLADRKTAQACVEQAKHWFGQRTSGYTRIVKFGKQQGDNTQRVILAFVDPKPVVVKPASVPKESLSQKAISGKNTKVTPKNKNERLTKQRKKI